MGMGSLGGGSSQQQANPQQNSQINLGQLGNQSRDDQSDQLRNRSLYESNLYGDANSLQMPDYTHPFDQMRRETDEEEMLA